ncbi:phosphate ABC transporter substrate-binding protein, PhoT family [Paracoccus alcaliphilus]|uniref:Phosphate ABC transporter substrate-binding protein, PhoT family n=1 Tax=Paracoccus alcaliphilus TaxID=34002 RepID=A0A1H8IEA1_9RHOB|nr:substrate-binding domain-containing protein [Paracoccus alcaliphilus]WCR19150.1 substrate-binding domain-containing protein [Paracoccus alcaliphilus]SEN66631.1 phosphate ABC transporter substrate-binding protein, PhoT family [Paracoccus alcaliphilus]
MKTAKFTVSALAIVAASAVAAQARDQVQVAGSSTVLPYSTIVAEVFGENTDFPTPVIESGGTGAGLQKFCEGVGENTIDIANASRPIREGELETCRANGVEEVMEVRIGYDGIVFASSSNGPEFAFTPADWFNALSAKVVVDGAIVDNTAANWSEVNADLPDQEILAFVPGTKHGTREVFEEKVVLAGCEESGALEVFTAELGEDEAEAACMNLRTDGRSVDIDGDYTETLSRIDSSPNGIGVFGLAFYENNTDKLQVGTISGVTPSTESIASGEYPVSRPLFFYVKKDHLAEIEGLKEFVEFFVSDDLAGPDGPLAQYGLVSDPELASVQEAVASETTMQ